MTPNFFIVGAPKAGTTSLYKYLKPHPDVFLSEPKELNYFSKDELIADNIYYDINVINSEDDYQAFFKSAERKKAIGEASVSYLFYPDVPKRIHKFNPNSKILITLREPVSRAFSHYLMDFRLGLVSEKFEAIIGNSTIDKESDIYYQQYVEVGLYSKQVERYFSEFGRSNVKVLLLEDLQSDSLAVMTEVFDFLNISLDFRPPVNEKHNEFHAPRSLLSRWLYSQGKLRSRVSNILPYRAKSSLKRLLLTRQGRPELDALCTKELTRIYADDITRLESLLQRDLSFWKENPGR